MRRRYALNIDLLLTDFKQQLAVRKFEKTLESYWAWLLALLSKSVMVTDCPFLCVLGTEKVCSLGEAQSPSLQRAHHVTVELLFPPYLYPRIEFLHYAEICYELRMLLKNIELIKICDNQSIFNTRPFMSKFTCYFPLGNQ